MPGYFVHYASAPEDIRSSIEGLKGLTAPDLWKKHTPTEEEYKEFFKGCKNPPSYNQVLLLCSLEHGGTHFGSKPSETNYADFKLIKTLFENGQFNANSMFFKGYVHHLRVDHDFYSNKSICDQSRFMDDFRKDEKSAVEDLHIDWDKTNQALNTWYPEVKDIITTMPDAVQKVIGFVEGNPKYVSLEPMHNFVESMRSPKTIYDLIGI